MSSNQVARQQSPSPQSSEDDHDQIVLGYAAALQRQRPGVSVSSALSSLFPDLRLLGRGEPLTSARLRHEWFYDKRGELQVRYSRLTDAEKLIRSVLGR